MSTYYFMGCDKHRVRTTKVIAVARLAGRHIDSPECLMEFLTEHRDCDLRFFSEHDDERVNYPSAETDSCERFVKDFLRTYGMCSKENYGHTGELVERARKLLITTPAGKTQP